MCDVVLLLLVVGEIVFFFMGDMCGWGVVLYRLVSVGIWLGVVCCW